MNAAQVNHNRRILHILCWSVDDYVKYKVVMNQASDFVTASAVPAQKDVSLKHGQPDLCKQLRVHKANPKRNRTHVVAFWTHFALCK